MQAMPVSCHARIAFYRVILSWRFLYRNMAWRSGYISTTFGLSTARLIGYTFCMGLSPWSYPVPWYILGKATIHMLCLRAEYMP